MSSPDNRFPYNPWSPYDYSRDCSQQICTSTCRQYCYLIFPPPPPSDDDSDPPFSPLIIAIIAVLASAFLLVSYYAIVRRYCRRRSAVDIEENNNTTDELGHQQWRSTAAPGLDEAVIKAITVCKYRKGDGLIEGTECAVCLGEFQDSEALRLLPKCSHAFHLPCIDVWLKSQPNCPLCRASVVAVAHPHPHPLPNGAQNSPDVNANAYQMRRPADLVLVVDDPERARSDRTVMVHHNGDEDCRNSGQIGRSVSLGTFSSQRKLLISDILKFDDNNECGDHPSRGIGTSRGLFDSPVEIKRSISTGGYDVHIKGKNLLPN